MHRLIEFDRQIVLVIQSCCRIAKYIRKQPSYAAKRVTAAAPYASMPEPVNPASAQVVNQHLLADLTRAGLWTRDLKNELVAANGSVQVRCRVLHLIVMPTLWCCWPPAVTSGGVRVPGCGI